MRIVRPGSVVGPQQQYMYSKQLEWAKWAAVDEIKKLQTPPAIDSTTIVAPATPPAEDEVMSDVDTTTTTAIVTQPLPPVTPSKHVAAAAEKSRSIVPPGQPRKTPLTKRTASEWDDDDDDEVFPLITAAPVDRPSKTPKRTVTRAAGTSRIPPASDQGPIRVTRSTTAAKKNATTGSPSKTPKAIGSMANKIPRLAHGTTTRNTSAKPVATSINKTVIAPTTARRVLRPGSPSIPSRLPTLITSKRIYHNSSTSLTDLTTKAVANSRKATDKSDAWVSNNASAVTIPTSKSERPGLRSTRRRRSSFSVAEDAA
jgi:cell division cycle 14